MSTEFYELVFQPYDRLDTALQLKGSILSLYSDMLQVIASWPSS